MLSFGSVLLFATIGALPESQPTTIQIREAVQRSIPYIEKQGLWWIEKKKCVTCHRGGTMIWSLTTAKQNGFTVSDRLDEWRDWAIEKSLSKNDKGKVVGLGNREGVAQILLSSDRGHLKPEQAANRKKLAALLRDGQQSNGSWKAGGQLPFQKRAKSETDHVSTMWLALALLVEGVDDENRQVVENALQHIQSGSPGKSVEWYALRLLLAVQNKNTTLRDQLVKRLRDQQKANGGWGWMVADESDALGTGMALYALVRAGVKSNAPVIQKAQQFLVSTQRDDGSWPVKGTKEKKKGSVQETAVYWGATWAVIGLVESLSARAK